MLGFVRILDEDDSSCLLDGSDPDCAVRAGAGQNDGKAVTMAFGQRSEEQVDRRPLPTRLVELHGGNLVVGYLKTAVRRNDVNMVRPQRFRRLHRHDGHRCPPRQNRGKLAVPLRIEVDDDDESDAGLLRQLLEKCLQSAQAASRRANSDNDGSCAGPLRVDLTGLRL